AATAVTDAQSHAWMVERLHEIEQRSAEENIYVGQRFAETMRGQLRRATDLMPPAKRWQALHALATLELQQGNEEDAIGWFERAYEALGADGGTGPGAVAGEDLAETSRMLDAAASQLLFDMGVAYMRLAETRNCCQRVTPESCIVPIRSPAVHTDRQG